jgi:hypothetical protein
MIVNIVNQFINARFVDFVNQRNNPNVWVVTDILFINLIYAKDVFTKTSKK